MWENQTNEKLKSAVLLNVKVLAEDTMKIRRIRIEKLVCCEVDLECLRFLLCLVRL